MMLPERLAETFQRSPAPNRPTAVRPSPDAMARTVSDGEARSGKSEPLVEAASSMPDGGENAPTRTRQGAKPAYSTQAAEILPGSSFPEPPKS
jgi:hypothetical protein